MNRPKSTFSKALIVAAPIAAAVLLGGSSDAEAQRIPLPPLPSVVIATSPPEYYEGRPVYWYHSNWYYRDGRGWNYYHGEPAYLRERRSHWGHGHTHYHYRR